LDPFALRIALLVKALPFHRPGGQENHTWTLARGLAQAGHHVTVVTTSHPSGESDQTVDGVRIVSLRGTPPGRNSWSFFGKVAAWARVFEGEFDILHAQGFAGLRLHLRTRPLVSTVHGTVWSETPLSRHVRPLLSWRQELAALWRFRERTLLGPLVHRQWRRSARLICDSAFSRRELLALRPEWEAKIEVVPLGIELPPEVPVRDEALTARPIRLISVGRLERVRGLDDLLEALGLSGAEDRYRLTIVGDGPHRRALEDLAEARGLRRTVRFVGQVDDETLGRHWRESDLFVNPEWSQPAFGLTSLEALGWGLPVLGTTTGATPEIVTSDVGWLLPPARPRDWSGLLAHFAADPSLLIARREAARRRAEHFTVDRMVEATVRAHRRAVAGS
jgi:glycosyltransferase involved in cell wall biosynthesis